MARFQGMLMFALIIVGYLLVWCLAVLLFTLGMIYVIYPVFSVALFWLGEFAVWAIKVVQ
jgi:hypothetical protein